MTSVNSLPRINFAPDLIHSIISGLKTATTRLANENDPNSDLDLISVGSKFSATSFLPGSTSGATSFAEFNVVKIELRTFKSIDQALALLENCSSADELKTLLKRFYPDLTDSMLLKVIHFEKI
jgi:hypothetical protein